MKKQQRDQSGKQELQQTAEIVSRRHGRRKFDGGKTDVKVNDKHVGIRIVIFIIALAGAIGGFGYGISSLFRKSPGWQEVTVSSSLVNCGDEFTFLYDAGEGELSASKELKNLRSLYSEICVEAYDVFDTTTEYEDCLNMCYLLNHVNEEVEVAPLLYQSLAAVEESGTRYLYTGTMTALYGSLTYSVTDDEAAAYDPYRDEDLKEFYAEQAAYICDPDSIHIELFGNNRVRLCVSDEYLAFALENNITEWIDFSWMKNAFIADYIADTMTENGYTLGLVMSTDGYVRCFDTSDSSNAAFPIYHRDGNTVSFVTAVYCSGSASYIYYRDYPLEDEVEGRYYMYQTGEFRYRYTDPADGFCKASASELVFCSEDMTCTELMFASAPVFIADTLNMNAIEDLTEQEITVLYYEDEELNIVQRTSDAD